MPTINGKDYIKGYRKGIEDGKSDALLEFQKLNVNTDLPSNETMFKMFRLLFECIENDERSCSCYINSFEHYANYITLNWEKEQ